MKKLSILIFTFLITSVTAYFPPETFEEIIESHQGLSAPMHNNRCAVVKARIGKLYNKIRWIFFEDDVEIARQKLEAVLQSLSAEDKKAFFEYKPVGGNSILFRFAIASKDVYFFDIFVRHGAKIENKCSAGCSVLHYLLSFESGPAEEDTKVDARVTTLLKAGARLDTMCSNKVQQVDI